MVNTYYKPTVNLKLSWQYEKTPIPCYSYGHHAATSLYEDVSNNWVSVDTRSAPDISWSG